MYQAAIYFDKTSIKLIILVRTDTLITDPSQIEGAPIEGIRASKISPLLDIDSLQKWIDEQPGAKSFIEHIRRQAKDQGDLDRIINRW